jgi:nucleoid-associated protein YgaU
VRPYFLIGVRHEMCSKLINSIFLTGVRFRKGSQSNVTNTVSRKRICGTFKSHFMEGNEMNKIIAALIAGLFAVSINAFAADAAAPKAGTKPAAEVAAPAADAATEKPTTPASKKAHKKAPKKAPKKAEEAKPADAAK